MRRVLFTLVLGVLSAIGVRAQTITKPWEAELEAYWQEIEATFKDSIKSPLRPEERLGFTNLDRYAPDPRFRVQARFKSREGRAFAMPTTTDRLPTYMPVGKLTFTLDGRKHTLTVYRNVDLAKKSEYANHLFVPFTDLTNGETTYGGGRYLDLEGPLGKEVELDFNKAYNPYCAYNSRYSCPIPPAENHLRVEVQAGVRLSDHH
ncbi:MAG: DUF1684 domain-containing protein [Flavobacteriales bacterium]|nr:DUF1684 domain-containing protein [Flavobacteriales bacterium]